MQGRRAARDRIDALVPCGPVALGVWAETAALRDRALAELEQFTARWADPCPVVHVHLHAMRERAAASVGRFLQCSTIRVDHTPAGLVATCRSGASGTSDVTGRQWDLHICARPPADASVDLGGAEGSASTEDNVEDLLELILTTAWRQQGWIPLHAGCVGDGRRCALLLAPAKGGKSTLTAAMLHRGWRALGDDKTLLALGADGRPEVRGLTSQLNLDPRTRTWFPEVGDLEPLPRLSKWTAKRRVAIEDVWGDGFADRATPTHVVQIRRFADRRPTRVEPLTATDVLSALMHQTVIPADPATAKGILTVIARSARTLRGVRFEIGEDAYGDPRTLDALVEQLE